MQLEFIEGEIHTPTDELISTLIMEQASDTADKLTELECETLGIQCYIKEINGETEILTYTEEAQDIFNVHYDEQTQELYNLLNTQLKIISKK